MTVRIYRSSDASAPVMSRAAGALVTLLTACLVDGYGAKTAAGWSRAYSGTNKAIYLQGTGSSGRYLRVDDSGFANYTTEFAGYTAATGVDTATGRFPLSGVTSVAEKSDVNDWVVVANEKAFYLFMNCASDWNNSSSFVGSKFYHSIFFGDINALSSSDTGRCVLVAQPASIQASSTAASVGSLGNIIANVFTAGETLRHIYFALDESLRNSAPQGRLEARGIHHASRSAGVYKGLNPFSGLDMIGIEVSNYCLSGANDQICYRGTMPGLYIPRCLSNFSWRSGQTFSGAGSDSGKTFEVLTTIQNNFTVPGSTMAPLIIETSDTWIN